MWVSSHILVPGHFANRLPVSESLKMSLFSFGFWRRANPSVQSVTEDQIRDMLFSFPAVTIGVIESVLVQDGHVMVTLQIDPQQAAALEPLRQDIETVLQKTKGVRSARVMLTAERAPQPVSPSASATRIVPPAKPLAPGVKHIIAVASGKGGVGKSTVAVNLAVALAQNGLRVGLLDADIYGPSVPTLLGIAAQKPLQQDDMIVPIDVHGIKAMSIGLMLKADTPLIWRGPMVQTALTQLLRDVAWGDLDVLVLDMPPGTGDAQLTVAQKVPLAGAVIVSTPQDIALIDAVKGIEMFRKVNVPILGLVENMSQFCCPHCGHSTAIFGQGGARDRAAELGVPVLGDIPLQPAIRTQSDAGTPIVLADPASESARAFQAIADQVQQFLTSSNEIKKY